jgi:hypothetical protein
MYFFGNADGSPTVLRIREALENPNESVLMDEATGGCNATDWQEWLQYSIASITSRIDSSDADWISARLILAQFDGILAGSGAGAAAAVQFVDSAIPGRSRRTAHNRSETGRGWRWRLVISYAHHVSAGNLDETEQTEQADHNSVFGRNI